MSQRTCLLRARKGRLVLGCWDPALLSGLRQSAQAVWPELKARIHRMTGLAFNTVQVEPCDPPLPEPPASQPEDPLKAVLERFRQLRRPPFTSGQD